MYMIGLIIIVTESIILCVHAIMIQ